MPLRFKGEDVRPVLVEAIERRCFIVLVKDDGVYFVAECGARDSDGQSLRVAYAAGCNPDDDPYPERWARASELGDDDFAEPFDPRDRVFESVLFGGGDLELRVTERHLSLHLVEQEPKR